jgi:hypothetical protein
MRLTILNEEEIDRLYGIPRFTQEARAEYLALISAPPHHKS